MLDNRIIELIGMMAAYIPQLSWENGKKRDEAINFMNEFVFSEVDLTDEEKQQIMNELYPID